MTDASRRPIQISLPDTGLDEWNATREPLESGWLTQGPKVAAFEKAFAARHEVRHALATTSCTTALHLILAALEIGPGDEVVVPAFTWVATANVVLYCGATPVLADVDPVSYNLTAETVKAVVSPRTRAIIAVHLFGLCADVDAIREAVPGVPVIEDAACAAGSSLRGRPAGTLGVAGAFSFHPRKSITTGEGGMATTQDDALAERMAVLRSHGASISEEQRHAGPRPYLLPEFNLLGFNYRMTDLQGAVGLVQLGKLDRYIDERERWASWYRRELQGLHWLRTPKAPEGSRHGWQSFVCWVDPARAPRPRNEIMAHLQEQGIATRPGTHAVHLLGLYRQKYGFAPESFPQAAACDANTMAIPLHNRMEAGDYARVAQALQALG
ncbi:DegT/DnrJ/EryC1/StrS family aminotransferase [Ramlibacter rhizophilus]|uniref:DegT/DnrJ/EryC1/StrS family aminotransferase n=1 Tax=Ramlibacter rhizophilus TaxID=1781167 RepID=A0A4Z0BN38_9BURK|nr:DegT/DnrJ/EryC1/StrS family aminotransferase [Ramlibacter rhizophilus]TFY99667.1 DegT/DnrJ/EryC1/StrS family aminotransferase [Ramlibacter rhizophilus]